MKIAVVSSMFDNLLKNQVKTNEDELRPAEETKNHKNFWDINESCCLRRKKLQYAQKESAKVNESKIIAAPSDESRGRKDSSEQSSLMNDKLVWTTRLNLSWPFASPHNKSDSDYVSFEKCLKDQSRNKATHNSCRAFLERPRSESDPLINDKVPHMVSNFTHSTQDNPGSSDCVKSWDGSGICVTFVPSKVGQWMLVNLDLQRYEINEAERVAFVRNSHRKKNNRHRCNIS